jgi:hypothetical protein
MCDMRGIGETGKYTPALALRIVVKLLLDHADNDVIADETALVHDLLGFSAERSLLGDLRSEHVTSSLQATTSAKGPDDEEKDTSVDSRQLAYQMTA